MKGWQTRAPLAGHGHFSRLWRGAALAALLPVAAAQQAADGGALPGVTVRATAGAASPIRARPCTRLNPMLGSLLFFAGLFDYENNSCPGLFHGRKRLKRPPETQH